MADNAYPSEKRALRILSIAYPDADSDLRENLAYLVSARRCTIDQALQIMLERKDEKPGDAPSPTASRTANAIMASTATTPRANTANTTNTAAPPTKPSDTTTAPPPPKRTTKVNAKLSPPAIGTNDDTAVPTGRSAEQSQAGSSSEKNGMTSAESGNHIVEEFYFPSTDGRSAKPRSGPTPAPTSPTSYRATLRQASNLSNNSCARPVSPSAAARKHFFYGDDVDAFNEEVLSQKGQVILFTTSMTGSRSIRDHSRSLETLLYVKKIPYHYVDIADNIQMQRLVREWHQRNTRKFLMPTMPLLFVDSTLIGNYEEVQDMENEGTLDYKLSRAGYDVPEELSEKPDYFAKERAAILAGNGVVDGPQTGSPAPLSSTLPPGNGRPKAKEVVLRPRGVAKASEASSSPAKASAPSTGSASKGPTLVTLPPPSKSRDGSSRRTSGNNGAESTTTPTPNRRTSAVDTLPNTPVQRPGSTVTASSAPPVTGGGSGRRSDQKAPLQHQRLPQLNTTTTAAQAAAAKAAAPPVASGDDTRTGTASANASRRTSGDGGEEAKTPAVLSHPSPRAIQRPTPRRPTASASATSPSPPAGAANGHTPAPRAHTSFTQQAKKAAPPGPTTTTTRAKPAPTTAAS